MADYSKLIGKFLKKAFVKAASLTVPATFHLKDGQTFDFGSAVASETGNSNVSKQVLVVKTTQGLTTVRKQILVERIDALDIFDKVTIGAEEWNIGQTIVDDGFMQIIEVYHG